MAGQGWCATGSAQVLRLAGRDRSAVNVVDVGLLGAGPAQRPAADPQVGVSPGIAQFERSEGAQSSVSSTPSPSESMANAGTVRSVLTHATARAVRMRPGVTPHRRVKERRAVLSFIVIPRPPFATTTPTSRRSPSLATLPIPMPRRFPGIQGIPRALPTFELVSTVSRGPYDFQVWKRISASVQTGGAEIVAWPPALGHGGRASQKGNSARRARGRR